MMAHEPRPDEAGLWAFCEHCSTLFLECLGNGVAHECVGPTIPDEDSLVESILRIIADGDYAEGRRLLHVALQKRDTRSRVICQTRLAKRILNCGPQPGPRVRL